MREEAIDAAVMTALERVQLSDEELEFAREYLQKQDVETERQRVAMKTSLNLQSDQVRHRISQLTDLLIDGTIEKSAFQDKHRSLLLEQAATEQKLRDLESGRMSGRQQLEKTVELAKTASSLYKVASAENKRKLLKILLSNLTVSGKKVEIMLAVPFRLIAEREKSDDGQLNRGTCRTWEQLTTKLLDHFEKQRPFAY